MKNNDLVQKVWNFCNTLRDDGVGYADYLEQLTFLIFLKLADEYSAPPYNRKIAIPEKHTWASLLSRSGKSLDSHYQATLSRLGREKGALGAIFFRAQNKIQDSAKLARLIQLIDAESWVSLDTDAKGDLYEGILQKNAEDTKSGAGQYFTPRPLIEAIIACVRPKPMKTIADPACGTGGFFLGAYNWLSANFTLNAKQEAFLRTSTFHGNEIVPGTRRMCLMNLFLHNIGEIDEEPLVLSGDALVGTPNEKFDYVFANPPFGKKSSMTFVNEDGDEELEPLTYERKDFWVSTSNKQLNFLQHICSILKEGGEAAVVLPDNVLFENGAGEKVRRKWLELFNVHTILRLPAGIFYAQGVKANAVFFNKPTTRSKNANPERGIWFYDLRTNKRFTLKTKTLGPEDLRDFVTHYRGNSNEIREESERFRFFPIDRILRDPKANLDIFWLKDGSGDDSDSASTRELHSEIIAHLEAALTALRSISNELN